MCDHSRIQSTSNRTLEFGQVEESPVGQVEEFELAFVEKPWKLQYNAHRPIYVQQEIYHVSLPHPYTFLL